MGRPCPRWRTASGLLALLACLAAVPAQAQNGSVSTALVRDFYSFNPGLGFQDIAELSIPVVVRLPLPWQSELLISSGYASLSSTGSEGNEDVSLSGILDTEARLSVDVLPGRLSVLLSGVLPSGIQSVPARQVPLLALISNEALDLSTVRFGSGGGLGLGFAGAYPLGSLALGVAGTVRQEFSYGPVEGSPSQLDPGLETRVRVGLEGPVRRLGYLRLAGVLSHRSEDRVNGDAQGTSGNLWTGYAALERPLTSSTLVLYLYESFRSGPRLEGTAFGPAVLPRSNVFAAGARWAFPLRRADLLTARVEYRSTRAAPTVDVDDLEALGNSLRAGFEYRLAPWNSTAVVFQAEGLIGESGDLSGADLTGLTGYRLGLHLEWLR
ncbi:MAG: hypothetical protein P8188_14745 [Gemmatimonadota bacterium]